MLNQQAKEQIIEYKKTDPHVEMVTLSGNRYNL